MQSWQKNLYIIGAAEPWPGLRAIFAVAGSLSVIVGLLVGRTLTVRAVEKVPE
jgi:hypothetical protein